MKLKAPRRILPQPCEAWQVIWHAISSTSLDFEFYRFSVRPKMAAALHRQAALGHSLYNQHK